MRSVNPATLDVVWEAPVAGSEDIALAVGTAAAAQDAWRRTPAAERRQRFDALLETLLELDRATKKNGFLEADFAKV